MDAQNPIFLEALSRRIDAIRDTIEINSKAQLSGWRFKNTDYALEGIQGAIIVKNDKNMKGVVLQEAQGLDFDYSQVMSGLYDPLIYLVLEEFARRDFLAENSIDLH